jgi:hypothetical protein
MDSANQPSQELLLRIFYYTCYPFQEYFGGFSCFFPREGERERQRNNYIYIYIKKRNFALIYLLLFLFIHESLQP